MSASSLNQNGSLWRSAAVSVCRLVEEVKQKCASVQLQNEDVYMATTFQDFIQMFVRKLRGEDQEEELIIDYVSLIANWNWVSQVRWDPFQIHMEYFSCT